VTGYDALAASERDAAGLIDTTAFTARLVAAVAADYRTVVPAGRVDEFDHGPAVYLFAHAHGCRADRTLLAVGRPEPPTAGRDVSYQRGYPSRNVVDGRAMDRGHFVPYSAGGLFGPNLFVQDRALNRGWSVEGRRYRALEGAPVAGAPRSLMFVRPHYVDDTDVPGLLDVGVVMGARLDTAVFRNRFDDLSIAGVLSSDWPRSWLAPPTPRSGRWARRRPRCC
jgi:hypothetical protein